MKVSGAITLVGVLADQQALAAPAGGPLRIDDPGNVATDRRGISPRTRQLQSFLFTILNPVLGTVFKTGDELLRASGSPDSMREKRDTGKLKPGYSMRI
jgi:hypothetical protein